MTLLMKRPSFAPVLVACAWLGGCVLEIKSSGELDPDDGGTGSAGETDVEASTESTGGPPGGCIGDCPSPAEPAWSRIVPTDTTSTWVCDVEVDAVGRVALAWRTESTDTHPQGQTGIDLMAPDGSLLDSVVVDGQTFSSIAFASDGTLRLRGATPQPTQVDDQWAMALDADLQPTWTVNYPEGSHSSQCDWGWSGALVDATDHLVTYSYSCVEGECPQAMVRRHAPDGTLVWEANPGGNPAMRGMPIALGSDQSVFQGSSFLFDDTSGEVEIRKYSPEGDEQWTQTIPHELAALWGDAEGGVYAYASDFNGTGLLHHLAADGQVLWSSDPVSPDRQFLGPAADGTGFFAIQQGTLQRTDIALDTIWTAPIEHTDGWVHASAVSASESTLALAAANTAESNNYWLSVMTMP